MKTVTVNIAPKPKDYDICIGYDYTEGIVEEISAKHKNHRVVIITDHLVKGLWGEALLGLLQKKGVEIHLVDFPAGEAYKTRETKQELENSLFRLQCGRDAVILALGGGVVGDMAGFVASTYMRGIPYYQIPTTLLAQADSSIGGKTAVDLEFGKNLVGTFYHPDKVFIDTAYVTTLDDANYRNGLVEVVKHGVIYDETFFSLLVKTMDTLVSRKPSVYETILPEILFENCRIKKEVVHQDPDEKGLRKILNFGHTVGHALEVLSEYTLPHGEAVAVGMLCEAVMGWRIGKTSKDVYESLRVVLSKLGIRDTIPIEKPMEKVYEAMLLDKKARNGVMEFAFLESIGKAVNEITVPVQKQEVIALLEFYQRM